MLGLMNSNLHILKSCHYVYQMRIKRFLSLLFFLCLSITFKAQLKDTTFFDIKRMVENEITAFSLIAKDTVYLDSFKRDTLIDGKKETWNSLIINHFEKRWSITKLLKGKDFPDIYFETYEGQAKALSDFHADLTLLIFNYAYCQTCLDATDILIDSLSNFSKTNKVQIITLLSDNKSDGDNFYEKYKTKVELGFITKENEQSYLLGTGTPYMYALDRNRKVIGSMYLNDIKNSTKFKSRILSVIDKN